MIQIKNIMFFTAFVLFSAGMQAQDMSEINLDDYRIPHQTFTLDNGLTLIVHEDHKAPIAAVNVWYHVGSKNEKEGKTGFAHLFEHLMFNGSENFNDDYFKTMERIGATDLNGTTNFDRTNYFQNVPTSALDIALWMESDRMGHFAGAISQERLDEQRGVVQNEKRQGENQPYGKFFSRMLENAFPEGHPYHHSVIGSMEDLNAASLEDVKEWFANYYGPSNAVLVIAGDVNAEDILERVKKYFGDIPPGPPVTSMKSNIARRTGTIRDVQQDRVPQSRLYMVWNVPQYGTAESAYLDMAAGVLASGKSSRLYKRLVYEDQIATSVNASNFSSEIAGLFFLQADVKPGVSNDVVEKAMNEELEKFLREGPTADEMKRIKTRRFANFTRGIERIGGFGGKSDILAQNAVYAGDPEHYLTELKWIRDVQASTVTETAREWLSDGKYFLEINPFPSYQANQEGVDRSKGLPSMGEAVAVSFPEIQRATLSNGMKVVLAERHSAPLVNMSLRLDAGYAADQFASPGTAKLAMNMLDEGTKTRNSLEISDELAMLGASLGSGSNLDESFVSLSALKVNIDQSLDLMADVILNPAFPEEDFERLKKQQLVEIQQEKVQPIAMALRVFPKYMYGEDHAYGMPMTGSGYESDVSALKRDDLIKFYTTWFKPNNATLTVVGDITMNELKPLLEKYFKGWKQGDVPEKNLAEVDFRNAKKIFVMDRPDAIQSVILAGHVAPPSGSRDDINIDMMNTIIGGEFTSRVNMNLREEKGWAYGAGTILMEAEGQRPFITYAPVQSDKTSNSMAEINKELTEYINDNPATEEELEKSRTNKVLALPGQWETSNSVLSALGEVVRFNLPDDYWATYADRVSGITLKDVQKAAKEVIHPESLSWIVVGDRAKIVEEIKALNLGEVIFIDADGNPINPDGQPVKMEDGGN
ncbi:M16 family metallopeptidase [Fulvivirga sedimenti]|uniref:Insulinase family protein n=1 Tax=Fulvivirga sedimenti TaxID=2879465 RepID=A0A9X1L113_9BACT|nr:pitrilysin family protein [Fulvivirga sedimenti]MCA6078439.1 insulinase family protein [Fulvivirga sedimenti]